MNQIVIKEVKTKKDLNKFIKFTDNLYNSTFNGNCIFSPLKFICLIIPDEKICFNCII